MRFVLRPSIASLALLLVAFAGFGSANEPRYPLAVTPATQTSVGALRTADFDGDGRLDLANVQGSKVFVRFGDGFGGFGEPIPNVTPGFPTDERNWTIADIDGDGDPDAAGVSNGSVWRLLNDGSGTLGSLASFPIVAQTTALEAGDLDGDGALDLVAAGGGNVVVLLGNGLGALTALAPVTTAPSSLGDAVLADLDGDLDLDVALVGKLVAGGSSVLVLLSNDGAGGLAAGASFPTSAPLQSLVTAGDVDGDQDEDLVVSHSAGVEVWRNQGGGAFSTTVMGAPCVDEVQLVDLDGSGLPELIALGGWKVQVFRDGGVLSNPPIERPTGGYAWSITAGLFDGDSVPDVVVSATLGSHGRFTFLRGDASTLLEGAAAQEVGDSLRLVGLSDLDGDADLDAVAVATTIGEVRTYRNDGAGQFSPWTVLPLGHAIDLADAVDLNGDGWLDLALTHQGDARLDIVRGLAGGQFTADPPLALPMSPKSMRFGNWNGDSRLDVVLLGTLPADVSLGAFALSAGASYAIAAPMSIPTKRTDSFTVIDANHDGLDDLVFVQSSPHQLIVYRNVILTLFTAHQTVGLDSPVEHVTTIDADGNAFDDLAIIGPGGLNGTRLLLGNGFGSFTLQPAVPDDGLVDQGLKAIDVDGDGLQDVVPLKKFSHGLVSWRRSVGDGTLDELRSVATGADVRGLEFGDVTGDGRSDFVVSYGSGTSPSNDAGGLHVAAQRCSGSVGRYGVACPLPAGGVPRFSIDGCLEVGAPVTLAVSDAIGAPLAWVALGLTPALLPIGGGCDLLVQPLFPSLLALPIAPNGTGSLTAAVPASGSASTFTLQVLIPSPALAVTNGVEVRLH